MRKLTKTFPSVLLVCLISVAFVGFGQSSTFNIADYKLPDLERHALDFYFNLSGDNSFRTLSEDFDPRKSGNYGIYNYISGNYSYLLNNERNQRNYYVSFYGSTTFSGYGQPDGDQKSRMRDFYPNINGSFINRIYFSGERFYEVSPSISNNLSSNYNRTENTNVEMETSNVSNMFSLKLPLRVGVGRIEPVQDARQAIYIYEALAGVNRTSAEKDDQEILELARFISKLKNMRIFDSRMRRIYELEALDSLLKANNQVLQSDGTYFATLNDFWEFGGSPSRLSGQRVSLALIPGYGRYLYRARDLITDDLAAETTTGWLSIYGGVEYAREKPINTIWQNSIYANLYGGFVRENQVESEQTFSSPSLLLDVSQMWGYYPDTRTNATLLYGLQFARVFDPVSSDEFQYNYGSGITGVRPYTRFTINYFVSPQIRVTGYFNLTYVGQSSESSSLNVNFDFMPNSFTSQMPYSMGNHYTTQIMNSFGVTVNYSLF